MQRINLFILILFFIYSCGDPYNRWDIEKQEFERKKSQHYSSYLSESNPTNERRQEIKSETTRIEEPIPQFNPEKEKSAPQPKQKKGFFSSLFGKNSKEKVEERRQSLCEELLDINKIVVMEQNERVMSLIEEKKQLDEKISQMEDTITERDRQDSRQIRILQNEISRLNDLIKILSSEIN